MAVSVLDFGKRKSIERQARQWLVRMDGDEPLTHAQKQALREWMSRSAAHRAELLRLCRFWNHANILSELLAGAEAREHEQKDRRKKSWTRAALMASAAVLVSVALAYFWLQSLGGTVTRAYETAIGEQKTIPLSDGSTIQLNTDSQATVAYSSTVRGIQLLRGEAFFTAAPDRNRAFVVYVADSTVQAIGTAFVVRLEGRRVDVTVANGAVDVSDLRSTGRASVESSLLGTDLGRLRAGEVASFDSGSRRIQRQQLADSDLQRRLAWQEGYLAFAGEPLSEVAEQLNRYSATKLVIADPKLASIAVGGSFAVGNRQAVLDLLSMTLGIRARQIDSHTISLESGPQR